MALLLKHTVIGLRREIEALKAENAALKAKHGVREAQPKGSSQEIDSELKEITPSQDLTNNKQIEHFTIGEALEQNKYGELLSYVETRSHEKHKAKVFSMSIGDLANSNYLVQGIKVLERVANNRRNEHYTPFEAFQAIKDFIPRDKIIWECFTKGNHAHIKSPMFLRQLGFNVIATGEDFFSHDYGEIVISNPPFNALKGEGNMKRRVLERLVVKLKKPFMLLMPSHFLQTKTLRNFINKHGNFQFIIPTQKVYFYHLDNKGEKLDYGKNYEIPLFYTMW